MNIHPFDLADRAGILAMIEAEGNEWIDYWSPESCDRFIATMSNCISYVASEDSELCGYIRCRDDNGFGIYIYDLLVAPAFRGHGLGRMLIEQVCADYPGQSVYVMSDADGYYEKQGYRREGSLFQAQ